tara:strand:- start:298 stop:456 length:159 start_codon:yes stop_codon:yes gene_type:complete
MAKGPDRAGRYVQEQRNKTRNGKTDKQRPIIDKEKFEKNWDGIDWKKKKPSE